MRGLSAAFLLVLVAVLPGCGRKVNAGGYATDTRNAIRIVGSPLVFPFTAAVAEDFALHQPRFRAPVVESTDAAAAIRLFCGGVGLRYPDIVGIARRLTAAERGDCARHGVSALTEVQIGSDAIVLLAAGDGQPMRLTLAEIAAALAARPGDLHAPRRWNEVDPRLPRADIRVLGPRPESDLGRAWVALLARAAPPDLQPFALRTDSAYRPSPAGTPFATVTAGAPGAILVTTFSDAAGGSGASRPIAVDGSEPSAPAIAAARYPGALPLFVAIKNQHLKLIEGMRPLLATLVADWQPGMALAQKGLVTSSAKARTANAERIAGLVGGRTQP